MIRMTLAHSHARRMVYAASLATSHVRERWSMPKCHVRVLPFLTWCAFFHVEVVSDTRAPLLYPRTSKPENVNLCPLVFSTVTAATASLMPLENTSGHK